MGTKLLSDCSEEEIEKIRRQRRESAYRTGRVKGPLVLLSPEERKARKAATRERSRIKEGRRTKVEWLAHLKSLLPEGVTSRQFRMAKKKAYVKAYKESHPCVDCGYNKDIRALQFDHRDRLEKLAEVSWLLRTHASYERLLAEIVKCDIRCANCHCIRSQQEKHWGTRRPGAGWKASSGDRKLRRSAAKRITHPWTKEHLYDA